MKKKWKYLGCLLLIMVMLVSMSMPNAATAKSGPTAETSANAAFDGCSSYTNGSRGGGGGGGFSPGPGGAKVTPKRSVKVKKSKIKVKKNTPKGGFTSGAAGEKWLNKHLHGAGHKTFSTPKGKRIVDVYKKKGKIANECKVGRANKTKFIKKQVKKDSWLLKKGIVKRVEWHFLKSAKTGKKGPSSPLRKYLKKHKISVVLH